jgi:hypothetical protein
MAKQITAIFLTHRITEAGRIYDCTLNGDIREKLFV